jgi:hypothetical protein
VPPPGRQNEQASPQPQQQQQQLGPAFLHSPVPAQWLHMGWASWLLGQATPQERGHLWSM